MAEHHWTPLSVEDLPRLQLLARACLQADGGLPDLEDEEYLRAHYAHSRTIAARDVAGELLAVAAVGVSSGGPRVATGLVHPSARGHGLEDALVEWALAHAGGAPLTVALDNATPAVAALMARHGLTPTFAETVMRHPLRPIPVRSRPRGLVTLWFSDDSAPWFHRVWRESFGELPGFADSALEAWVEGLRSDPRFRPRDSVVLLQGGGRPIAFCTLAGAWIEQVGVVPDHRGRGLGAHLVARSLTRLSKSGEHAAWLTVSDGNPALALYERLGFRAHGHRAIFAGPGWPHEPGDGTLVP